MVKKLCLTLLLISASLPGLAQPGPTQELIGLLQGIDRLQGQFEQQQFDEQGAALAQSSGEFGLLRPGYFRWDIRSPDSQLVIADTQYLWHYDRDLETVTRRSLANSQAMSPMQILGGDTDLLAQAYVITRGQNGSFVLEPKQPDSGFSNLSLRFDAQGLLSGMSFTDPLKQRLDITFADLDTESPLTASDFQFVPPADADLFIHE